MGYVYIQSEKAGRDGATTNLWTVGFYDPTGKFVPESDHVRWEEAAKRVSYLNGGGGA